MSSQTQGTHATLTNTGIDFCDDAASGVSPHGTASSLARRVTQEEDGASVQDHEVLVSEVTHLRDSLAHTQKALDQYVAERKQFQEILVQVHVSSHRLGWLSFVNR